MKLRIIYDGTNGEHVPDGLVATYVNHRLAEFACGTGWLEEITVGNATIIDEFRLRILKGEISHESLYFMYRDEKIQPNEYATMKWPRGFADLPNDQVQQIVTLQSKKKRRVDSK